MISAEQARIYRDKILSNRYITYEEICDIIEKRAKNGYSFVFVDKVDFNPDFIDILKYNAGFTITLFEENVKITW